MRFNRKILISVAATLVVLTVMVVLLINWLSGSNHPYTLSGTIEATEIRLSTRNGGIVKQVYAGEGEAVEAGERLVWISNSSENITSPVNGVLLERLFEPGELALPGNVVMVVADLKKLELKVYAPEDRYGQYSLGQTYPVTVDSFPGETFSGRISHIASQAEFTPRNVQTIEGRKSTVFAITLEFVDAPDGKLIPGMPADVHFNIN
jgi:multidrug resistance efflux pump